MKKLNEVRIKDALYNLHPTSGASITYCKGLVIGIVSALLATGYTLEQAKGVVKDHLPNDYRPEALIPLLED